MRKFALFLMLALTASAVTILSAPVFAQEMTDDGTSEEMSDEITTTEDEMSVETTDEMATEETTDEMATEETADEMATEETTDEMATEETTDEMATEETADDSSVGMAETTMLETHTDSPLKQMSMGVDAHQIQCSPGYKLVFKASNWNPSCVKESSFQTLLDWGWIANHDPSHEELTKMLEDHMAKYPPVEETEDTETEQDNEAQMEENMDVDDASNTNGTDTDQPEPQSHTVNLTESMDMGAQ